MTTIRSYRDLDAWKRAMVVAVEAYRITEQFPRTELFGLVQQLRRAAVSIPSSIAEGHSRRTRQASINHLNIALGSLAEFETQLTLSIRWDSLPNRRLSRSCGTRRNQANSSWH